MTTIFWFRQDLRVLDNLGLFKAAQNGKVLPIYIWDNRREDNFNMGSASRWWLHHSLHQLNKSLDHKLNVYHGDSLEILVNLINDRSLNIEAVYWNRCYEPLRIQQDTFIKKYLKEKGIVCESFNGSLLWEPWQVLKKDQTPYKVYTPYYNACIQAFQPRIPIPEPTNLSILSDPNNQICIDSLNLLPEKNWYQIIEQTWTPGEKMAHQKLNQFFNQGIQGYKEYRNYPHKPNISQLSPYLHFGEISPHQIWHVAQTYTTLNKHTEDIEHFKREIVWREFSYYLLYHFPELPYKNFQPKFDPFPWINNAELLKKWQTGQTGYPIVDAGMRELWQTGYMHNRVRMIVASFLVKNLFIHWHQGEKWFWDCLVDADLANNSASWQWVAGSGADAAPYFRIFNPVTQGEKFDPEGEYTRKFVPELIKLPNKYLFKPWEAPEYILHSAGISLGKNYPKPIVDLKESRERALIAYKNLPVSG